MAVLNGVKIMMTAFLTGIANGFDIELAKVLSANGYKVYAGNSGRDGDAEAFAEIIRFDPDNSGSIDKACEFLLENPGHIDLYVDTSNYKSSKDNFTVADNIDYDVIKEVYTANVLRPIGLYEGFFPLMKSGTLRRYCFITDAKASINHCKDVSGYGFNMSKAGLYNFIQIMKNKLMPEGFTFRVFDPLTGALSDEAAAKSAFNYFTRRRGIEGRDDELKLVIRDAFGRQQNW